MLAWLGGRVRSKYWSCRPGPYRAKLRSAMQKVLTEMVLNGLVFLLLYFGLLVFDPGRPGSLAMALVALAALAALEITSNLRSARDRALVLFGDACLIAALVLFADEDNGGLLLVALALLVVGGVSTTRARKRSGFRIEMKGSEPDLVRKRRWIRGAVIADLTSVVLVLFGVPWWTTIFVVVMSSALVVYVLRDAFRVVRYEVDQEYED